MKKSVLLLDDSSMVSSRLVQTAEGRGWLVLGPDSRTNERPDALVLDPAWENYQGLFFLRSLHRRFGRGRFPVQALLRDVNPSVQALLSLFGVPFTLKRHLVPESLFSRIENRAADPFSASLDTWKNAVADWASGKDVWGSSFEERLLTQGLLRLLSGVNGVDDARTQVKAYLVRCFPVSEKDAELSLLQAFEVPWNDTRVQILWRTALELVVPFFQVLEDIDLQVAEVEHIESVFSRFLPSEVIGDLLRRKSDEALLRGEKRNVVALFSHIRDFDFYIENNEPSVLVEFLNRHFQLYSDIIRKHGGFINKYIGDAVFALFGAPVSYLDNAPRALAAAKEISEALTTLQHPGVVHPPEGYRAGIGLNQGFAIVGNIGSTDSFDYTAIGDAINLAARLESLNKHYKTKILLSETFSQALTFPNGRDVLRTVDSAKVKGKKTATTFYTVVDAPKNDQEAAFLDAYEKGLKMIKIGNWLTAKELLDEALALKPDDLCRIHRDRAYRYEIDPPQDWDGAETLSFK